MAFLSFHSTLIAIPELLLIPGCLLKTTHLELAIKLRASLKKAFYLFCCGCCFVNSSSSPLPVCAGGKRKVALWIWYLSGFIHSFIRYFDWQGKFTWMQCLIKPTVLLSWFPSKDHLTNFTSKKHRFTKIPPRGNRKEKTTRTRSTEMRPWARLLKHEPYSGKMLWSRSVDLQKADN